MAAGWWCETAVPLGWWDETASPPGWFDENLLSAGGTDYSGTGALQVSARIDGDRVGRLLIPFAKNQARLLGVPSGLNGYLTANTGPFDYAGTGALAVAFSLAGSGAQSRAGTGALAAAVTLSGSGALVNLNLTGTGALVFAATLAGSGAKSIAGTGALSVSGAISGDGTTSGLVVEPEGTQKPAGGSTPRRRRVIEDDEEELEETAEEVIERLLEAARVESVPQRRVVRRIATRAAEVAEAPTIEAARAVVGEVDALLARINAQAADRYLTDLVALRLVMEQIAAQAAEDDDEEALMLLL